MLHVRSIKKAVNKAFYSPSQKIGFCRRFAGVLPLANIIRPAKTARQLELFTNDLISIKN
jgi:hypothetical protein